MGMVLRRGCARTHEAESRKAEPEATVAEHEADGPKGDAVKSGAGAKKPTRLKRAAPSGK